MISTTVRDVEDLKLQTTIHPQTTASFISVLPRAISDDHSTPLDAWMSSAAFKRLRRSLSRQPALSIDIHTLLALDMYHINIS